jgi:hypothetical protein
VLWEYSPGVIARLQGECANIAALADQLHPVTKTVWDHAVSSLGPDGKISLLRPPPTPPSTSTLPTGGYTFGLAH